VDAGQLYNGDFPYANVYQRVICYIANWKMDEYGPCIDDLPILSGGFKHFFHNMRDNSYH
jgi:hypothetical protein